MDQEMPILPVRGRAAAQDRSLETKRKIVLAAIEVIAERGLVNMTHRLVADRAGVRLAATTYYYETKSDIVADVSNTLLNGYADDLEQAIARLRACPPAASTFSDFVARVLRNSVHAQRAATIAWLEILLNAARHPENVQFARLWAARLRTLWAEIAGLHGIAETDATAQSAIDLIIGLLLELVALAVNAEKLDAVFLQGANPFERWVVSGEGVSFAGQGHGKATPKSVATRARILTETMQILIEEGAGAVNYRLVARRAELTPAALAYHFSPPAALLREAQERLFESFKARYRVAMSGVDYSALNIARLVDLTSSIFLRETTEFGKHNLASNGMWLEAARMPELRPVAWNAIADLGRAWGRIFEQVHGNARPADALLVQCLFVGKLIRIRCLGATTPDLANVREEFLMDIQALVRHEHWALNKNGTDT